MAGDRSPCDGVSLHVTKLILMAGDTLSWMASWMWNKKSSAFYCVCVCGTNIKAGRGWGGRSVCVCPSSCSPLNLLYVYTLYVNESMFDEYHIRICKVSWHMWLDALPYLVVWCEYAHIPISYVNLQSHITLMNRCLTLSITFVVNVKVNVKCALHCQLSHWVWQLTM